MNDYIDLHTHTSLTDGSMTPNALVAKANAEGLKHIALTDHNFIHTNLKSLRKQFSTIEIISGSEISASWPTTSGKKEIHIVGLFLDEGNQHLQSFLSHNHDNGIQRLENMLERLAACGITLGGCSTYQDFHSRYYPERTFIGRVQLAEIVVKEGYAATIDEVLDKYIGDYGKRLAYVPSNISFGSLYEVIKIIHSACGVAILAHPLSYKLADNEIENLINCFIASGGDGMECLYSRYPQTTRTALCQLAEQKEILISCGSDFHGNKDTNEHLGHYPGEYLEKIRKRHLYYAQHNTKSAVFF